MDSIETGGQKQWCKQHGDVPPVAIVKRCYESIYSSVASVPKYVVGWISRVCVAVKGWRRWAYFPDFAIFDFENNTHAVLIYSIGTSFPASLVYWRYWKPFVCTYFWNITVTISVCCLFYWFLIGRYQFKRNLEQVWYFRFKSQEGLQHSDPLKSSPGSHSLVVNDFVGIMSSCLLLAFPLSVSLAFRIYIASASQYPSWTRNCATLLIVATQSSCLNCMATMYVT